MGWFKERKFRFVERQLFNHTFTIYMEDGSEEVVLYKDFIKTKVNESDFLCLYQDYDFTYFLRFRDYKTLTMPLSYSTDTEKHYNIVKTKDIKEIDYDKTLRETARVLEYFYE